MASKDKLAEELLRIERKQATDNARKDELKAALKQGATENFKVTVDNLGVVKVSAPKDKACKGTAPEIVVEAFLALPEKQREKLTERGIVKIAEQWSGAYYGSVTVELF